MSRSTSLLLAAVFCGANVALVQPIAQAKTKVEIARIAKNITLRIEAVGADTRGSGILLQKQGDVYTVLTAGHVVAKGSSFKITAFDGQVYSSISVRSAGDNLDLAIVKFRSSRNYAVASVGASSSLESGMEVYVAGFPAATSTIGNGVFNFTKGEVTGNATNPNSKGYSLIYNSITLPGMSGGPVLNSAGQLVAVHGQGDRDASGQKTGFNLGIVIERFGTVAGTWGVQLDNRIAALPRDNSPKAADFFLAGNDKYIKKDYPGALQEYNQAIALNPNYASVYNNRGVLKNKYLSDIAGALADYNKAIEISPNLADAYYNRGNLKDEHSNDFAGALADYSRAIELDPQAPEPYNNRGLLKEIRLNDQAGALADYNQAIQVNPLYAISYNNRGLLKLKLNDSSAAMADYNRAIQINPSYADAYSNRGDLKSNQHNISGALADYDKAIQLNPRSANTFYNRGLLHSIQTGDRASAIRDFRQAASFYRQQGQAADLQDALNQLQKLGVSD
jgi:tetratricopeptide (TPR) repeat protein